MTGFEITITYTQINALKSPVLPLYLWMHMRKVPRLKSEKSEHYLLAFLGTTSLSWVPIQPESRIRSG